MEAFNQNVSPAVGSAIHNRLGRGIFPFGDNSSGGCESGADASGLSGLPGQIDDVKSRRLRPRLCAC